MKFGSSFVLFFFDMNLFLRHAVKKLNNVFISDIKF